MLPARPRQPAADEYLYEEKPDATFARIAAGANADIIVCGHTHRPYDKKVGEARFFKVGSAGRQVSTGANNSP